VPKLDEDISLMSDVIAVLPCFVEWGTVWKV